MNSNSEKAETEMMEEQFAVLRKIVHDQSRALDELQSALVEKDPKITSLREGISCLELALTFYEEANIALQAGAWFAAASVASSALESVLLYRCFFQQREVMALQSLQKYKPSPAVDFTSFARSLDLGKLLKIANELSWFPDGGIPNAFLDLLAPRLDRDAMASLNELFAGVSNVGRTCAEHVREYRNLLHPAVCLKEGRQPSREAGLSATFLFLIAFASLAGV